MSTSDQGTANETSMREWLTTVELAREALPGLPGTSRGLDYFCARIRASGPRHLWREFSPEHVPGNGRQLGPGKGVRYHYSCLPVEAIAAYEARYKPEQPIVVRVSLSTVLIASAENGRVRAFVIQQLAFDPSLPASQIRDRCIARFGAEVVVAAGGLSAVTRMPSVAAFQSFIKFLRIQEGSDAR